MPVTAENKEYSQLAQLVPLNTLSEDALKSLLQHVDIEAINKGGLVFREGAVDGENVYLISGRVGLLSGDKQVDLVEEGSATARFPIAHQLPRKFSAKAISKIEIVRIDSRSLSEALAENETSSQQIQEGVVEEDDEDWMSQLLQSRVMQNIPAANLQGVMMRMEEVTSKSGDQVITEGDEGDYYYLLHRGQAQVLKFNEDQSDQIELTRLSPGAAFGEDALLSGCPRTSSVKMLTDGILLRLAKDDFIELIQHPLSDTVNYEAACKLIANGGMWLDVRNPEDFEKAHLPGAINMPHPTLRFQIPSLSEEHHYVIVGQTGTRGIASAFLFLERGLQVSILDGGYDDLPQDVDDASETIDDSDQSQSLSESASDSGLDQAVVEQLQQQIKEMQHQLNSRDELLAEARSRIEPGAVAEGSADPVEIEKLKKENEKLEREIIGLTGQLESEEDVYDKLKQQYDSLSTENKKHLQIRDKDIASLKEELTVMQLEKDELESDYEELLKNQPSGDEVTSPEQEKKLLQASNQIEQLEALNASITEDRDKQRFDLDETRNQLSLINQENSELQLEITELKAKIAELTSQHASSN